MSPTSDASPPSKVATIVTTQPFSLGSFRTALAWEASGSACRTVLASALTVTVAAATSRPLTTVRAAAGRGSARVTSAGCVSFGLIGGTGAAPGGAAAGGGSAATGGGSAAGVGRMGGGGGGGGGGWGTSGAGRGGGGG